MSNSLTSFPNVRLGYFRGNERRWESGGCYLTWGQKNSLKKCLKYLQEEFQQEIQKYKYTEVCAL